MQTKTLVILGFLFIIVMLSSCEGKRLYFDNDDDMTLTEAKARMFLENDDSDDFDKRANSGDCVLCKFNAVPCCKPNICHRKRFRPDECIEIKGK
ncbi:unnamed protein product [Rotaria sp. Silwood1]|nr:unnamed protein product [Rotaria sp. Silwood1]CAF1471708.1 unnamed protein product [Rotaria sp. Silwood1]CAF1472269.1 unnamed protein product [Rotaria sp. Silwood1]CAF3605396.1 unnamed protein product [Rotaria sp. Silwood1]CAF3635596.1 unnamed protein product [Rotaria sp. Silwood1]